MTTRRSFARIAAAIAPGFARAQDWPQWRGPARDGSAAAGVLADNPSARWKVQVGEGHSSPLVAGHSVYQFARQGDREIVMAFNLDTGKRLWQSGYAAPYEINPAARAHGKGPKSTPVIHAGKLYTLGMSGVVLCTSASEGGVLWRYDTAGKFKHTAPLFGVAASPLIDGDRLIVYLGTDSDGALTALDTASGKPLWEWKGDGPGYGSPVIAGLGPARQIVAFGAGSISGVAPANGKLLWTQPFTTPYAQNSVTPLVIGEVVIYSGLQRPVTAVRVTASGAPQKLWENTEADMYMSSPVLCNGCVYGLSNRNKGHFFALDPKTGKTLWRGEPRQAENALLVARGQNVLALTTAGELHIFRASANKLEPLRKLTVAQSATWAHPAISGNRLLIKDFDSLAIWA